MAHEWVLSHGARGTNNINISPVLLQLLEGVHALPGAIVAIAGMRIGE